MRNSFVATFGFALLLFTASHGKAQNTAGSGEGYRSFVSELTVAPPPLMSCDTDYIACASTENYAHHPHDTNYLLRVAKDATHFIFRWPKHCFAHPIAPPVGGNGYGYFEPQWRPFETTFAPPVPGDAVEIEIVDTPLAQ
ncbi:hypothetical protein [Blastopirellula marina]|uniref:Uncharacterized protein n=1 Tax=Blastopirellula marina DSM 3645 TaxID=314230 RepID=A3ZP94_9BACT|nr:hypothetical protein [Blastopirellula marina]EAQ81572.1 hypothetical protein DSM3645_28362 [Blastopirellula marina DSM 3645]